MAPVQATDDYYTILEVTPTATLDMIVRSYRRLAFKLHPDRNKSSNATEAFQLLGRAYTTLNDEKTRRAYDLNQPSIARKARAPPATTPAPPQPPSTSSKSDIDSDATQIAALRRVKQERAVQWQTRQRLFAVDIADLRNAVQRLEKEIANLTFIAAAEAAEDAQKNSWGAWLLSPFYKRPEESEEVKARKDRARQERRIEKDLKERRLVTMQQDLKMKENAHKSAMTAVNYADSSDDRKIWDIEKRIRAREERDTQQRAKAEQERLAKVYRQQQDERMQREKTAREEREKAAREQAESWEREWQEKMRKWEAEKIAEEQRQSAEASRSYQQHRSYRNLYEHSDRDYTGTGQFSETDCQHGGWWSKVQGRTACPRCSEVWTYLLECPICAVRACPRCQSDMRPRVQRQSPRRSKRPGKSTQPTAFDYDEDWADWQ